MKPRPVFLCFGVLIAALTSHSMTVSGVDLPQEQDGLELHGAGVLRKGFVFKVYVGALYLDEPFTSNKNLNTMSKRIDIHYFHHTPKKFMLRAAARALKKNLKQTDLKKLTPKIAQLHEAFINGEKGRVASIIHRPGEGLQYLFDNQPVITIPGDDFANAYFSIWLGDSPSSRTIKNAMLSGMAK